jgi:two-component system chemotaxis response regulator CheB
MISVLVADDSFLMRKLIGDMLSADPEIVIVGSVADGEHALSEARRLKPDVITMDLEMPTLNGLEATRRILQEAGPRPIVLMLSAFERDQADAMLECLHAGAFDCIVKPSGPLSLDLDKIKAELIAKVKAAASARRETLAAVPLKEGTPAFRPLPQDPHGPFPLILIGSSTGGPPVLEQIFSAIGTPFPAAILVVQHMPEKFTATMAERLDRMSAMKIVEARDGETIKPGIAYVAPGNHHMRVEAAADAFVLRMSQDAPVQGMRPSIDVLMDSACACYPGPLLGLVLTGMGEDGAEGLSAIRNRGGLAAVQDPQTCVVDSMVRSAMAKTDVDAVVAPAGIAAYLSSAVQA